MATDPLTNPPAGSPPESGASRRRPSRFRERSLLLNPAPVLAATIAAFTLALGGLTARLVTGHDPALGTLASAGVFANGASGPLTTRASGAASGTSTARNGHATAAPLVTSTSGGVATATTPRGGDDA